MKVLNGSLGYSMHARSVLHAAMAFVLLMISVYCYGQGQSYNGFKLGNTLVDKSLIMSGGPPRDGIPSLFNPTMINAKEASFLQDNDRIIGINIAGQRRAYPINILNWHELVNDQIADRAVLISYCPLCGTGMVFDRHIDKKTLRFGVSGLLYNSDVLFYDHSTESLWSQIMTTAISGPMKGQKLKLLAASHSSWGYWKKQYPDTLVLSNKTGYDRDYSRDPYVSYRRSKQVMFPVTDQDGRLDAKDWVLGINHRNHQKAYALSALTAAVNAADNKTTITDRIGNNDIIIRFHVPSRTAEIFDEEGELIAATWAYWFAWYAFYPETELFE
ncbi:MAG: DUF3179 domain-containing protein [Pseudomonadales bacterium]|nr:DUF3179 domain-containing protein [Pseudomonadales bacterium]